MEIKEVLCSNESDILNDEELKGVYAIDNYIEVYTLLEKYCSKYSQNLEEKDRLQKRLLVDYLKIASERNKGKNFLEQILIAGLYIPEEVLEYCLSQELDMHYCGYDLFGMPIDLVDCLALRLKKSNSMKLLLSKIEELNEFYFGSGQCEIYTDLCRMNIIAGNLDEALVLFNDANYSLFPAKDEEVISRELHQSVDGVYVDEFNGEQDDLLFQILETIRTISHISDGDKKAFLEKILYSGKIKLFNVANLPIITEIADEEGCQRFVAFLWEMVNSDRITLFRIDSSRHLVFVESFESMFPKSGRARILVEQKKNMIN